MQQDQRAALTSADAILLQMIYKQDQERILGYVSLCSNQVHLPAIDQIANETPTA